MHFGVSLRIIKNLQSNKLPVIIKTMTAVQKMKFKWNYCKTIKFAIQAKFNMSLFKGRNREKISWQRGNREKTAGKEEIEKKSVGETSKHNLPVQIKPAKKDVILNNKLTFYLNKLSHLSICNINKIFKTQKANVQF